MEVIPVYTDGEVKEVPLRAPSLHFGSFMSSTDERMAFAELTGCCDVGRIRLVNECEASRESLLRFGSFYEFDK